MAKRKKDELGEDSAVEKTVDTEREQAENPPKKPTKGTQKKKKITDEAPPLIDQSLLLVPTEKKQKKDNGQQKQRALTEKQAEKKEPEQSNLPTVSSTRALKKSTVPLALPTIEKRNLLKTMLAVLLLAAILITSGLIFAFRPAEYYERTHSVELFYDATRNETVVAVEGTSAKQRLPGAPGDLSYNQSGKVCAAIVGDALYLITGKGKKDILQVASGVQDFVLASGGAGLAYRTAENLLFYYGVHDKKSSLQIAKGVEDPRYAISPDGKELFYTYVKADSGKLHVGVYSRTDSAPFIQHSTDLYPIAVADRCKYLYCTDAGGELYVILGKTGEKIPCGKEMKPETLVFNQDLSQITFQNGTETRFYVNGKAVLVPEVGKTETLQLLPNQRMAIRPMRVGSQYLCRDLLDQYYLHYTGEGGTQLVFLKYKKKGAIKKFVSNVDGAASVTVTDKAVYFLSTSVDSSAPNTKLFRCKNGKTDVEQLAWDVVSYCANVDGSRILYTDVQGALYARRIGGTSKRLCDSVDVTSLRVNGNDNFYFYTTAGVLAVSDNGDEIRVVREGVASFFVDAQTMYFITDQNELGVGTVHAIHRGRRKVQLVATGVC